jgi:hypothetical protein
MKQAELIDTFSSVKTVKLHVSDTGAGCKVIEEEESVQPDGKIRILIS